MLVLGRSAWSLSRYGKMPPRSILTRPRCEDPWSCLAMFPVPGCLGLRLIGPRGRQPYCQRSDRHLALPCHRQMSAIPLVAQVARGTRPG